MELPNTILGHPYENLSIRSKSVRMFNRDPTEGAFIHVMNNASIMSKYFFSFSPVCVVQNLDWKISVAPLCVENNSGKRYLSAYLYCDGKSGYTWSCLVEYQLVLINHNDEVKNIWKKSRRSFTTWDDHEGGYFLKWDEVMNPANGYRKDDKIVILAIIKPQKPRLKAVKKLKNRSS